MQINEEIRDKEVRVVTDDGEQLGIMPTAEALQAAAARNLDLVKIAPQATPPVCKIMDYGKYRFDAQKREKEAKKNQKIVEIKEIRLSATIDIGDTQRLAKQTAEFIADSNKVKASIRLKGRQQAHPEIAVKIVEDYIAMVQEKVALTVEKAPMQEGRMIYTILAPQQKK